MLITHFHRIAETFGDDHGRAGTLAFNDRIRCQCGAVDDEIQILSGNPGLGQDRANASHDAFFRRLGCGQYFACEKAATPIKGHIGKCAADVNGQTGGIRHSKDTHLARKIFWCECFEGAAYILGVITQRGDNMGMDACLAGPADTLPALVRGTNNCNLIC